MPKKLDVSKLKQDSKRQAVVNDLCSRLDALEHSSEDIDDSWTVLGTPFTLQQWIPQDQYLANTKIGLMRMTKKIQGLLEEKHQKHKAYLRNTNSVFSKTAYSNICMTVQTKLRDMQDSWLSKKADEIQSFADRKNMKKFLMHSRQYMVPRAQEPPHSLVQMELVF